MGATLQEARAYADGIVFWCDECGEPFIGYRVTRLEKRVCGESCRGKARRRDESYRDAERERVRTRVLSDEARERQRRRQAEAWRRSATPRWATEWEEWRRRQDSADVAELEARRESRSMLVAKAPASRLFIGASCQAPGCDSSWVSYAAMPDCDYCSVCNPKRWRDNHRKRVKSGVEREHIDRHAIFERDGYRCQICGKKTRGKYPAPSSPSLDHIIPLSKGGSHTWDNVRCAHFGCNARKRAGAANDQMLLPIGPPTRDGGTG